MSNATLTSEAAAHAARQSYGKLVAWLAARSGDVAAAEDALADAFAAALAHWPDQGVPRAPEAWLLAAARRRMIDAARRHRTSADAAPHLLLMLGEAGDSDAEDEVPDWRLRLMFACAHPAIDPGMRGPLMLQTVLGLDAAAIAAAFLVAPATMGQRLVRAKRRIREAGIPFRLPERTDLPERLEAVLDAIYAAFTTGWGDPANAGLADEAVWLGRVLVELLPAEPEALGLLALMLHATARVPARRATDGAYVPLSEQDPAQWDATAIEEAEQLLRVASGFGRAGRFQLEAAVQSVHAARRITGRTDWAAIVALYDALLRLGFSPVVAVNRAVALTEAAGPAAGLQALVEDPRLAEYQPYWAARAELLTRCGEPASADTAYAKAIALATDAATRQFLEARRSRARAG